MGKIKEYTLDSSITGGEKLIGSDIDGATVNITIGQILTYITDNIPSVVIDYSDLMVSVGASGIDKTGLTVFGSGVVGINGGGFFIGVSSVADPTLDAHISEFLLQL